MHSDVYERPLMGGNQPGVRLRIGTLAAGLLKKRAHDTDFLLDVKTLLSQRDLRVHGPRVVDSDEGRSELVSLSYKQYRPTRCDMCYSMYIGIGDLTNYVERPHVRGTNSPRSLRACSKTGCHEKAKAAGYRRHC